MTIRFFINNEEIHIDEPTLFMESLRKHNNAQFNNETLQYKSIEYSKKEKALHVFLEKTNPIQTNE